MSLPVAEPAPRSGFGIASLVLGILLVVGVALWLMTGSALFLALVWVLPLVIVAAIVIGAIHLVVAVLATVFGILAIARNRGRIMGIIGIVLTVAATAAAALVAVFFFETLGALSLV
ncbi:hypothetical protein [Pseudolysinimonas yzui]|uniref:Uncharacterized protein n=1 Tax=Pseudolysinimonas yzui TaxID=2708254 RepID=A0A8J3GPH4_9MICO|nr:hypothetical protein [Pseudolysinimonas yzui]GHF11474.1 hypothetical protein GCM10011600_10900 [Pseudolysinimonas yzui]